MRLLIASAQTVVVTATSVADPTKAAVAAITLNPADFTLSTATGMATILGSGTTSYTVSVAGINNFSGTVVFDAPGLPAGVTASFNPASISGPGQTIMTVTATSGLGGYYLVTARGTSGSLVHTTGINLAVQSFTATPAAYQLSGGANSTIQYVFAITSYGGFNAPISVVPDSVQFTPNPNYSTSPHQCSTSGPNFSSQPGAGTVTVTLFIGRLCDPWLYDIPLALSGGNTTQSVPVRLQAVAVGTFSLAVTPAVATVAAGTNTTFTVNVQSANGFNGQVNFTATTPSCATVVAGLVPAYGATGSLLTLGTSQCAPGTYAVNIVGTNPSNTITSSVTASLVISGPPAPATMISPLPPPDPSGALGTDTATFTWTSGSQVSQYQLDLNDASDGTVISPRYSGTAPSATMSLAPCRTRPRPLTATLTSTFASGATQAQSYRYTCGSSSGVSVAPTRGTGFGQVFTATFQDPRGGYDISQAVMSIQPNVNSPSAGQCIMRYDPGPNNVYLLGDDGVTYLGPIAGGGGGTLANSQCAISGGDAVQVLPSALLVDFSVIFAESFAGAKQVFLSAQDSTGNAGALVAVGTWTVPAPVTTPATGVTGGTPPGPDDSLPTPTTAPPPVGQATAQSCSDVSGTWSDPISSNPAANISATWSLSQTAGAISGSLVLSTPCGNITWPQVSGQTVGNVAAFTATNPSPTFLSCNGSPAATSVSVKLTLGCGVAAADETANIPGFTDSFGPHPPQTNHATGTWTLTSTIPEMTLTTDIVNDAVTVKLDGQNKRGNLSVTLNGDTNVNLGNQVNVGPGQYGPFKFQRTTLPAGAHYSSVTATWDSISLTAPVGSPFSGFKALGLTRFSRYNTPTESLCDGGTSPVYIFENDQTCTYTYNVFLKTKFIVQTNTNATGVAQDSRFGLLKRYSSTYLEKHWCLPPEGSIATGGKIDNVFVKIKEVTGSCNTTFSSNTSPGSTVTNTIATSPDPHDSRSSEKWVCSDQVLLVKPDTTNDSIKVVQDLCPRCNTDFGITNGHIDTYTTSQGCLARDPSVNTDYGNFYGIRLR